MGPYVTDDLVKAITRERHEDARQVRPHQGAPLTRLEAGRALGACRGVHSARQLTRNLRGLRFLGGPHGANRSAGAPRDSNSPPV